MPNNKFESIAGSAPEKGTKTESEPHQVALLEFVVRSRVALNKLPKADTLRWRYDVSSSRKNFDEAAEAANLLLLRADLGSLSNVVSFGQSLEECDGAIETLDKDLETAIQRSSVLKTEDAKETMHALWLIREAIDPFRDRTAQT